MPEKVVEALRERTRTAQQLQVAAAEEAQRAAEAKLVQEEIDRQEHAAKYVAGLLRSEIRKMQDGANAAADKGEASYKKEWTVQHDTTTDRQKGHKIASDVVAQETANTTGLQQALATHLAEVGFTTEIYEKPVGYREEVLDYGNVFHETGKLYGVSISWAE